MNIFNDIVREIFFYKVGYYFVKLFSLGKFPRQQDTFWGDDFLGILGALITILVVSYLGVVYL